MKWFFLNEANYSLPHNYRLKPAALVGWILSSHLSLSGSSWIPDLDLRFGKMRLASTLPYFIRLTIFNGERHEEDR